MSRHKMAEEAEREFIERMGVTLGRLFNALWQEISWLYEKWNQYLALYGGKPSRIDLLNRAAPYFFGIIQDVLWEDIVLHIARLTDRPQSVGKENLTIRRIPNLVDDAIMAQKLGRLIDIAIQSSEFCRDWRNRHIAHRDLNIVLKGNNAPLKPANRKKIKEALDSIADVLNAVSGYYGNSEIMFDIGERSGGALALLYLIYDGLKAKENRQDRIRHGELREEDFKPRGL
jgi:hypothetical protein